MKTRTIKNCTTVILTLAIVMVATIFICGCGQTKVNKLTIDSASAKTQYYAGEYFDISGVRVLATMSDGTQESVKFADNNDSANGGYTINLYKKQLKVTDTEVAFTYKNQTAKMSITVVKNNVSAPNAEDIVYNVTTNTIDILGLTSAEYKIGQGEWSDSNSFGGLDAGRTYAVSVRFKETDFSNASQTTTLNITTSKNMQSAIEESAIILTTTSNSITVSPIDGAEYRLDDGEWTTNNVFSGLTAGQTYNVKVRKAETSTANPSSETTKTITL